MESKSERSEIAINISYDAFLCDYELEDFEGVEELKLELSKHYVSKVKGTPVGRGGGVYEFFIDLLMNISLEDFLKFISQGLAFDAIKSGTKSLVLKPFMRAFEDFNKKNGDSVAIREFKFQFEDSEVVIRAIDDRGVYSTAPEVFLQLSKIYNQLRDNVSNKFPNRICIPVVWDEKIADSESSKYRELLIDEEEYLNNQMDPKQYFEFWGLSFEFNHSQSQIVFDLENKMMTAHGFYEASVFERFILPTLNFDGNGE